MTSQPRDALDSQPRDALDLLEDEDQQLRRLFSEIEASRGSSVEERALYGDLAKDIVRHLANREAALVEVQRALGEVSELRQIALQAESDVLTRRQLLDQLEKMSRGVQGINLNVGQDFDSTLQELIGIVSTDIARDLSDVVPSAAEWLSRTGGDEKLGSAQRVLKHAPTSLNPKGPRWYERAPVVSRVLTIYDHLRDFPRAVRHR